MEEAVKVRAVVELPCFDQRSGQGSGEPEGEPSGEHGWALIGLLLALAVMSIFLASSVVPNVQKEVQRDKEMEMMYRGQQMAEGIARYYGKGRLAPLNIMMPPTPLPYLTDLEKLRDGVSIGVREIKFVRPSALIDPITGLEWEPVRARDPRIMKFLQAWAAETLSQIPAQYLLLAAPPQKSAFKNSNPSSANRTPDSEVQGAQNNPNSTPPTPPGGAQVAPPRRPPTGDDDDDDDDDNPTDPLAHLFDNETPGHSNAPIVGVASKKKGPAMNAYFGLSNYQEWIFLYIPKVLPSNLAPIPNQPAGQGNQRNRVSP
jgi:type II secretory pathway pseudopilin PulG